MSDAVIIALVAGIPASLTALAGLLVSMRTGRKADHIITLTNSNLSLVTKNLEIAQAEIQGLKNLVASMVDAKTVADRVADLTAMQTPRAGRQTDHRPEKPTEPETP